MSIKPTLKKSKIVLLFLILLISASPVASQIEKKNEFVYNYKKTVVFTGMNGKSLKTLGIYNSGLSLIVNKDLEIK